MNLYAVIASAFRKRSGWTVEASRDRIASMYSGMSRVALDNPHAWRREAVDASTIRNAGPTNPMLAFPYTRNHSSSWSVDQAGALLICSVTTARRLDLPPAKWIFPLAVAESNFMSAVSQRANIGHSPGVAHTVRAVLEQASMSASDLDLVELYSCFPVAVELFAEALGLAPDAPRTITGGMPWAGGPYNNYVIQATCRMAEVLRAGSGTTGLVTSVSGLMTKLGAAVWGTQPPSQRLECRDVSRQVAADTPLREVIDDYSGPADIAGYTVLFDGAQPTCGVAVLDVPGNRRTVARTLDAKLVAKMQVEECCGVAVSVSNGAFA